MPLRALRRGLVAAGLVTLATLLGSCGRDVTGPAGARRATIAFQPTYAAVGDAGGPEVLSVASIVPFTRVRVLLVRTNGDVAIDRLVDFPADADSVPLAVSVTLGAGATAEGEQLAASLRYVTAQGDTVFAAGPVPVQARPSGSSSTPQLVSIPLTYVGPGRTATSIVMTPDSAVEFRSQTLTFNAVVRDAQQSVLSGVPVAYTSTDTTIVQVGLTSGVATLRGAGGTALVIAQTLTGQRDTARVRVLPAAGSIVPTVNTTQYSVDFEEFSRSSLNVRVRDAAGLPLTNAPVTYRVVSGGGTVRGSSSTVVRTDAGGLTFLTPWQTTPTVGTYRIEASVPDLPPVTFTMVKLANYGGQTNCREVGGIPYCWGFNFNGEVGNGNTNVTLSPTPVTGLSGFQSFAEGRPSRHTCILGFSGQAFCWGDNSLGQIGDGTQTNRLAPTPVQQSGIIFTKLFRGINSTCGLTTTTEVYCWGWMSQSRLGDGNIGDIRLTPTKMNTNGLVFTSLALAWEGTCGTTASGGVHCWNNVTSSLLGEAVPPRPIASPTPIPGLTATLVAGGDRAFCAAVSGGGVKCWGEDGGLGQFGDGRLTGSPTPVSVVGLPANDPVTDLRFVGWESVCAITGAGRLFCWGRNHVGQLGDGTTTSRPTAVEVGTSISTGIGFNRFHPVATDQNVCAIARDGASYCWGNGPLGDGLNQQSLVPKRITIGTGQTVP